MASILSIPLELLVLISSHLTTPELGSLRCTCRQIETSLFDNFAKEFFAKKQFMLTPLSLQALIDISNHPSLSKQVKHVIIGTDQYSPAPFVGGLDAVATRRWQEGYLEQLALVDSGADSEMLAKAFSNLPNLNTVGIRDFVSRGRPRDGNAFWSSYGNPTVLQKTGLRMKMSSDYGMYAGNYRGRFASRLFLTLLRALAHANRTPPTVEVHLRETQDGVQDYAFVIPYSTPELESVLQGLQSLLLTVNIGAGAGGSFLVTSPGVHLRKFLRKASNISHLRLNFQDEQHPGDGQRDLFQWLAKPTGVHPGSTSQTASADEDDEPVRLSQLRRLDIGMVHISLQDLLGVIVKFATTLEALHLWKVTLSSKSTIKENLWVKFFATLSRIPQLKLKHIFVGAAKQFCMDSCQRVSFSIPQQKAGMSVELKGQNALEAAGKIADQNVIVEWPQPVVHDDSDSDEDMDEDEGDEDDI
ncbi:hypothetical protein BS50DRAFT_567333 [Corynespora cassiicola Philippines]|uniref:F-box domain-containing protein n=1 Tax=Corynespora cassiicola Philippines TaxID=1448308 RepID=A0A2T2PA21_CORCC|nr:hypothetical protein BS50DRAFT_567333 [Corynespora cassiicola Philippines]